ARERVARADAAVETARRAREATGDQFAQREADERIAQSEDREATAAGELGMLQQTFAQNPAGDDEQNDVLARYAGEPDEVVDELPRLREELARLQAN